MTQAGEEMGERPENPKADRAERGVEGSMTREVHRLLDEYVAWLRDKTTLRHVGDQCVEITTPHLDRHNDHIVIYARKTDSGYTLTDGGETIVDLEQSGFWLENQSLQFILEPTLNGFGVQMRDKALEVHASPDNFALRKHNLIQAILAINSMMFYLAVTVDGAAMSKPQRDAELKAGG